MDFGFTPAMVAVGLALTIIVTDFWSVQPLLLVTVTEYVVVEVGVTVMEGVVWKFDHL
jgi:hypothetical protein